MCMWIACVYVHMYAYVVNAIAHSSQLAWNIFAYSSNTFIIIYEQANNILLKTYLCDIDI